MISIHHSSQAIDNQLISMRPDVKNGTDVIITTPPHIRKLFTIDAIYVGHISNLVVDFSSRQIKYAILTEGGFFGSSTRLHAIPWQALTIDAIEKKFTINICASRLSEDQGFERDSWPDLTDLKVKCSLERFYKCNLPSAKASSTSKA